VTSNPAASSRLSGIGAIRVVPTGISSGASGHSVADLDEQSQRSPHVTEAHGGTRDVYALPKPRPESFTSSLPVEFSPSVMYVRDRLRQMVIRSQVELEPYPPDWLIQSAWNRAWQLILPGMPTPSVVPSEDGNVALVWHKRGWDAEVEFGPSETDVWAANRDGTSTVEGTDAEALKALAVVLRELEADLGSDLPA
jgi:hypothetical protein